MGIIAEVGIVFFEFGYDVGIDGVRNGINGLEGLITDVTGSNTIENESGDYTRYDCDAHQNKIELCGSLFS